MANRRMFSKNVARTDAFLDMSQSAQNLYFHLGIDADDDGFVSPKMIMRMLGSTGDDLKILIAKGFLLPFEDGVVVITHWKVNNDIRTDRYKETQYVNHKNKLGINAGIYEVVVPLVVPAVSKMDTQVRLGKVRLDKENTTSTDVDDAFNEFWQSYPKKVEKKKASLIWKRNQLSKKAPEILAWIEQAKQTVAWEDIRYIKNPTTFLNGECWNDDLSAYAAKDKVITNLDNL